MAIVANLVTLLTVRTTGFEKGIKRSSRSLRGFASQASRTKRRLFGFAAGLIGTGSVVYGLMKLIKVASDSQEIMSKFDVVFRKLSKEASAWADTFADSVGRAKQDIHKWMAGLQDTFVPLGYARDKAFELSRALVSLAVDVGSFNNIADDTVIRDFTSALVGNHEAVRKYGIIITETSLKQKAITDGISKTGKDLTDLQKVQTRYNIILGSTKDAQGDAIRTGDSYANQVKRMKANITNLSESVGQLLIPVMSKLVKTINANISGMNDFQEKSRSVIKGIGMAAAYIADVFVGAFNVIKGTVAAIIGYAGIITWSFGQITDALGFNIKKIEGWGDAMLQVADKMTLAVRDSFANMPHTQMESFLNSTKEIATATGNIGDEAEKTASKILGLNKTLKALEGFVKRIFEQTRTPFEKYEALMDKLHKAFNAGLVDLETMRRASKMFWKELKDATKKTKELQKITKTPKTPNLETPNVIGQSLAFNPMLMSIAGMAAGSREQSLLEEIMRTNERIEANTKVTADKEGLN